MHKRLKSRMKTWCICFTQVSVSGTVLTEWAWATQLHDVDIILMGKKIRSFYHIESIDGVCVCFHIVQCKIPLFVAGKVFPMELCESQNPHHRLMLDAVV